ncbi:MAG: hypothetical protein GF355_07815, partial [Candidatus Eisenbacteria bacterium]|nr:hypothetical protein [Candidatus Eisenbacteria bacterium]
MHTRVIFAFAAALCLSFVASGPAVAATIYVPGDYALIQDAIDAAAPGDTVSVAAGTYQESMASWKDLEITKSLTLAGAGSGATVIELSQNGGNGIEIRGADLTVIVEGITFTRRPGNTYASNYNLRIAETASSFDQLTLRDVEAAYAYAPGVNLGPNGTFDDVVIENCNFHHCGTWGFLSQGVVTGMTVIDSHFGDNGVRDPDHGIGFDLSSGSGTSNVTVTGGTFNNNAQKGINIVKSDNVVFDGVTLSGNGATGVNPSGFVLWEWQNGSGTTDLTVTNATITGNTGHGILVGAQTGTFVSGVTVTQSTITGNSGDAILLFRDTGWAEGPIDGVEVHECRLDGNGGAGLAYSWPSSSVDASCNWWGDAGGPDAPPGNPNPAGAAAIGATITYWPWWMTSTGPCDGYGPNNVAAGPGDCLSIGNTCATVPVNFNRDDTSGARGISVTFQLSSELELCDTYGASIDQGTWLAGYNSTFQVYDNGGGSYTVDQAILGSPCGVTTGGELFTVDVTAGPGADPVDSGTITVTDVIVRDCNNQPLPGIPGEPGTVTIDTVAPVPVDALAAQQIKTGNDADGTTEIALAWSDPGEGTAAEIYRKGFGAYPEYDDGGGAVPSVPADPASAVADGWTQVGSGVLVADEGYIDEPGDRDFWYYVVFSYDDCGNVSAVSDMTGGTLNYHLGDTSDGVGTYPGDNDVGGLDASDLGSSYGTSDGDAAYDTAVDYGPTTDFSVDARPTTDDVINFEDLIVFAINYGQVSATGEPAAEEVAGRDAGRRPAL